MVPTIERTEPLMRDAENPTEYTIPENDTDPTIMYAVWDDETGIATILYPTRTEADNVLPDLLAVWGTLRVTANNVRVREIHIHDNGIEQTTDPADDCPECGTTSGRTPAGDVTVLDFRPGDKVVIDAWGSLVFDVVGYGYTSAKGDLVKVSGPNGSLTGAVPPTELRKVKP
jgi:hypothetical protein